jgi:FtsH-binding integral membrane protein
MDFLKGVAGKVVTGLVALAVIATAVSWFQMDESSRATLLRGTGRVFGWLGIVLVVPWAGFFLIGHVARMDSNAAGAALVLAITVIEAAVLAWLFDWSVSGAVPWVFFATATLFAGVYNLFACDWIAEKAA